MSKDWSNCKWSVIGSAWNEETQELMEYIKEKTGVEPKFFALYSTMMAFIRHAGINENRFYLIRLMLYFDVCNNVISYAQR